MKDRVSAVDPSAGAEGEYLAADESHLMPMSSRYIPLPGLPNSPTRMSSILKEDWRSCRDRPPNSNAIMNREISRAECFATVVNKHIFFVCSAVVIVSMIIIQRC